jgi:hypothetical protein
VLQGEIVQETNSAGQTIRYVYLPDGTELSTLIGFPKWKHDTPGGTGLYETFQSGFVNRVEFDPYRANVGLTAPPPPDTNGGDGDIGHSHNGGPADSRFSDMANPAAGCFSVGGVDLPCTWSSFDVFEFFVWGPARQPAKAAHNPDGFRTWVPGNWLVPLKPPNPFEQVGDVVRTTTTHYENYVPGHWVPRSTPNPFLNITVVQKAKKQTLSKEMRANVEQALSECIPELYSQYSFVSFQPTQADADGIVRIRDVQSGAEANIVSDSSPPPEVVKLLVANDARGMGDSRNPWWTYAVSPMSAPSLRPGEMRYPSLYLTTPGMDWVRTQIHETGAALTHIRDRYYPGPWAVPDREGLDPRHPDDGPAMENCVGKKIYQRLGLKPNIAPGS